MVVDRNADRLVELNTDIRRARSGKARRDLRRDRRRVLSALRASYADVNDLARGWAFLPPTRVLS
jgi:hypothetical protein